MTKRKYKAIWKFKGHEPGEEFEADLDPDLEKLAVGRGQIEPVKTTPKKKEEETK